MLAVANGTRNLTIVAEHQAQPAIAINRQSPLGDHTFMWRLARSTQSSSTAVALTL